MIPEARPITRPPGTPTNPEAGVIAARPAIEPVAIPNILGFFNSNQSQNIHAIAAVAAEICVTTIA